MQPIAGRYIVERRLAEGGMGQVFRARHAQLGKVFALKIIAPAFAEDELARARFNQEAKLASEIAHPNIVSVVDFGEDATVGAYMVMELVEGEPLMQREPMSVRRALDVLGQIADVLDHIHRHGIIHGDIKPENIMLVHEHDGTRRRDSVRLIDFGLAQRHGTANDRVDGTPQYLAPERAQGAPATVQSDIYALGVLGYELLTGTLPFNGTVLEILHAQVLQTPPKLSDMRGERIDPAVEALIERAMAKDPAQRHATASAFRYELNAVLEMLGLSRRRRTTSKMRPLDARTEIVQQLFEGSSVPQALISEGVIAVANAAFAQLLGQEHVEDTELATTPIAANIPELMDAVRSVLQHGKPMELSARIDTAEDAAVVLAVWIMPFSRDAVQMLVRADELHFETVERVVELCY